MAKIIDIANFANDSYRDSYLDFKSVMTRKK